MEDDQGTTASSTSATSSTTTTSPRSHPVSVYSGGERHTVQVIQQALNRPTGSATQYLQQMYAAQQQHIMLQTAALQQQHIGNTQLQSLAALQQASLSGGKQPSSPTGTITQQSSMSQTSMNVSTTPTPAQLISRSQVSSTSSSSIAQQTMLLGSTSPTLTASQAQLYLRAQMEVGRLLQRKLCFSTSYHPQSDGQTEQVNQLIFTPAATATTVHSDIPVTTSSPSCQSSASQIQNVTHRSQTPGPLSGSQKSPPRICAPSHHLAITHNPNGNSSKTIQSDSSVEMVRKRKSPSPESPCGSVTHPSSMQQITPTGSFSSFEPHPLLKHQQIPLHSISPKGPHYRCVQPQHHQQQNQQQQQQHQQQQKTIQSMLQQSIQTSTHQNPPLDASMPTHCIPQHTCTQSPAPDNIASLQCSSVQTHAISLTKSPSQPLSPQQSVVVSPGPTRSPSQSPSIIMHPQSHRVVPSSLQSLQNVQRIISNEVPPVQQQTSSVQPPSPQSPHIGQIQSANVVSLEQQIAPQPHQQQCTLQSPPSLISNPTTMPVTFTASVQPLAQQTMQDEAQQPKKLSPRKIFLHNAFISEEDLPAAEALVQLPFQIIPPPQTVAVNLQVEPSVAVETPVIYQVDEVCEEEMPDVVADEYVRKLRTPTPPTLSPQCVCVRNEEEHPMDCTLPDHVGVLMEAPPAGASVIKSPSDSSCASLPPPPLLLPAVTKSGCTLMPNCIPSTENGPPQAIVKPQILTHVIEGFVIQEGLEPFPVNKSSLLVKRREKERQLIGIAHMESELLDNEKQAEFSTDTDVEDNAGGERKKGQMRKQSLMTVLHGLHQETRTDAVVIAIDGIEEMEREVLKCEFCGQMGHANKFLRSKRFCSISCAKRYTANFPKRCGLHKESKTSQWKRKSEKSLNQCPRLSSGSEGKIRERYLRQLPSQYSSVDGALLATDEDSAPTVMTTRLRRKRERERERKGKRRRKTPENMDLQLHAQGDPSFWTVEEVWAFIQSLPEEKYKICGLLRSFDQLWEEPRRIEQEEGNAAKATKTLGCHYIADEFRTHEIDGQALLLLREDHLMSAMNIKLGPALKICAQINSLKE